ncbi:MULTISPECIES: NprX family peptide pheromone [Bacillus]|nr:MULTISPECIES: NprX family peptide pheromone [Bacillus]
MKKIILGTFVIMTMLAVVFDVQYAWKPDNYGQEVNSSQSVNL